MRNYLLIAAVLAGGTIAGSAFAQQLSAPDAATGSTPGLVQMGGVGVPQAFGSGYASSQDADAAARISATPLFAERSHGRP